MRWNAVTPSFPKNKNSMSGTLKYRTDLPQLCDLVTLQRPEANLDTRNHWSQL